MCAIIADFNNSCAFETRENKSVPKLNRVQSDLYDSQRPTATAESSSVNKLEDLQLPLWTRRLIRMSRIIY